MGSREEGEVWGEVGAGVETLHALAAQQDVAAALDPEGGDSLAVLSAFIRSGVDLEALGTRLLTGRPSPRFTAASAHALPNGITHRILPNTGQ